MRVSGRQAGSDDAAVAVRSLPRRYRELLIVPNGEESQALVRYRPEPGSWSTLEHAAHVSAALAMAVECLEDILIKDRPSLSASGDEPGDNALTCDNVLAALTASAERLAGLIEATHGDDWRRVGIRKGIEVSALDLTRKAVHEGVHHLREMERAIQSARRDAAGRDRNGR